MKLSRIYFFGSALLIGALWISGMSAFHLAIMGGLFFLHASFQIWARGDAQWSARIDRDAVRSRMSWPFYSVISSASLLLIVLAISAIASA
jgi:hypothetical protein